MPLLNFYQSSRYLDGKIQILGLSNSGAGNFRWT